MPNPDSQIGLSLAGGSLCGEAARGCQATFVILHRRTGSSDHTASSSSRGKDPSHPWPASGYSAAGSGATNADAHMRPSQLSRPSLPENASTSDHPTEAAPKRRPGAQFGSTPWNKGIQVPTHLTFSDGRVVQIRKKTGPMPKPKPAEPAEAPGFKRKRGPPKGEKLPDFVRGSDGELRPRLRPGPKPKPKPAPITPPAQALTVARVSETSAAAASRAERPVEVSRRRGRPTGTRPSNTGSKMPEWITDKNGTRRPRIKPGLPSGYLPPKPSQAASGSFAPSSSAQ